MILRLDHRLKLWWHCQAAECGCSHPLISNASALNVILSSVAPAQARAEVYDEVICFIRLLNNLLQNLTLAHMEQSAHFTQFVLTDVFGQLHQRAYRYPLSCTHRPSILLCS